MPKKLTTEEFIAKARAIHGDKYDYSKVVYKNNHTKVIIVCPEHGEFLQVPKSHLEGNGCPDCAKAICKHSTKEFIARAKEVHGDRYDYSLVEYKGHNEKVTIICPVHGPFEQKAYAHLEGRGCQKCGIEKLKGGTPLTTEEFIKKAKAVHGDKYDYSLVEYERSYKKVKIICPEHGVFEQTPAGHLSGQGCKKCRKPSRKAFTQEEFERRVKEVHGDNLDVSQFDYVNALQKGKVICNRCGMVFNSYPHRLYKGQGCLICDAKNHKWPNCLYLAVDNLDHPTKMKIGITRKDGQRLRINNLRHDTPFNVEMVKMYYIGEIKAREIEKQLHHLFGNLNCRFNGFIGASEWFYYDNKVEKILEMLTAIITAASYRNYFHK